MNSSALEFNILLVEDSPGDRDLILAYLEGSGKPFQAKTAGSLKAALKMLDECSFNVVFLDLGLPDSIGLDTLGRFISNAPEIPIIVLTGLDDEQLGIEAIRLGAQDYLVKGRVNTNMLLQSLRHAIERGSLNVKLQHYNRMLQAIRSINQLIVREKNRNTLIQSACDLLIQDGHYLHCWISLLDTDDTPGAFAQSGLEEKTDQMQALFLKGEPPPCCEKAMESKEVLLFERRSSCCLPCPLARKNIGSYGMVVRLSHEKKTFGIMTLAVSKISETSEDELSLVKEVASDIGLALYGIEQNEQSLRAEAALQASEKKHRHFLDNLNTGVVAHKPDTTVLYCNQKALHYLGLTMDQIQGKTAFDPQWQFLNEDQSIMVQDDFPVNRSLNTATELENYVVGVVRSDRDHVTWLACSSHRVMGPDDTLESILISFIDITETKQASKALQESKQKFQSMVNNIGIGVALINQNMEIIELNQKMMEWFPHVNISQRPICYHAFNNPPRDTLCDYCPTCKTLRDGKVHESRSATPQNGRIRNYRIVSSPIINEKGQVSGAIEMVEDITEHLKLENRLRQSQKLEAIGNLAGGIAHDFNNILTAIMGFAQLILSDVKKGSDMEDDIHEIITAGVRARDLINQVLVFARQSEEELIPLRVDLVAKEVLKLIRSSIPSSIEIKSKIETKSRILGNTTQCHQIFMNLCTNAAYAMEQNGGILDVSIRDTEIKTTASDLKWGLPAGEYIKIVIKDTGVGIPENVIKSIFDPYFTTKPLGEGTGMGLSVVHGIVESYEGKIFVESIPKKGTEFTIFIPITKRNKKNGSEYDKIPSKGMENILVVDDEISITKVLGRTLGSLGYTVTKKNNAIDALALFKKNSNLFDLVITDMTMPNMTGDKLAAQMIAIKPDIPVILCTGYSKKMTDQTALEMGIKALVYKPIITADLAKTIRTVLDDV